MPQSKKRSTRQSNESQLSSRASRQRTGQRALRRQQDKQRWRLLGGVLVALFAVVGIFVFLGNQQTTQLHSGEDTAARALTSIAPSTFATVGLGTAQNGLQPLENAPILKDAAGKPIVLYVGAEYCPYCAAQRWAVIAALSRFGSFKALTPLISGEGNIPTFTFHGSSYSSPYLDFQAVETGDNQPPPQTQPMDSLSSQQQQIFEQYNRPPYVSDTGKIPFIDVANQFVSVGSYYSPDVLSDHSYQEIVTQLKDPSSAICRAIVGAANCLTAAICHATGNQPTGVCAAAPIPQLQQAQFQTGQRPAQNVPHQVGAAIRKLLWTADADVWAY